MKPADERRWRFWPGALSLRSMRGRMALLLGLAMLPAGAIAMQVGLSALSVRQAAYETALQRRALQSISEETAILTEVREMLRVLATTIPVAEAARGECVGVLGDLLGRYPYLASISVITEQNGILCSSPEATGAVVVATAVRNRARERDSYAIGYEEAGFLSGQPELAALEPIRGDRGRRIGFVRASVSLEHLRQIIDSSGDGEAARTAIVDHEGRVLVETSHGPDAAWPTLPTPEQVRANFSDEPIFIALKGGASVVAPLHAPDLYIVQSWAPEQQTLRRLGGLAISVAAPVLIWLLAIGAGWFAIEVFVTRPLSALEGAARAFARGEDTAEAAALVTAPEEIRGLRRTPAAMAKTLRGREQRLVEALAEERALLREVNHRVKNNLQMVASLLNIQSRSAHDESEARGLARAHDRVQLLALVHQRIYASGEVRELRLDELTVDVARNLLQSRGLQAQSVVFDFEEVRASADRAVPLAFLIGEAVSAALEGVTAKSGAELCLYLRQDDGGEVRFAVEVNGAPAPAAPLGAGRLIDAFARQLGAVIGRDAAAPRQLWVQVPPQAA